jgi:hypothetical protein
MQRNMVNSTFYNDSILVSAVQLKRWMRQKSGYNNGRKVKEAPATIYIIHINTIDGTSRTKVNDEYQEKYVSMYPDVCGDIPPGLPPQRNYDHHIVLENNDSQPINQAAYRASASDNDEIRKQLHHLPLPYCWLKSMMVV